jgi:hypothetical protein
MEDKNNKKRGLNEFLKWIVKFSPLISLIAAIITVVALWFAWDQQKTLTDITKSISTYSIGNFPGHMSQLDEILKNVEAEKDSIIIFQDFAYYGIYSSPEYFDKLLKNINTLAINDVTTYIVVYTNSVKKEILDRQFNNNNDSTFSEKEYKDYRYEHFKEYSFSSDDIINKIKNYYTKEDSLTGKIFFEMLSRLERYVCKKLEVLGTQHPSFHFIYMNSNEKLGIYCWSNGHKAIFTLPRHNSVGEIAFSTRDNAILNHIKETLDDIRKTTTSKDNTNIKNSVAPRVSYDPAMTFFYPYIFIYQLLLKIWKYLNLK